MENKQINFGPFLIGRNQVEGAGAGVGLEERGDLTAHWCKTVGETAEILLNFNSMGLWRVRYGGSRSRRPSGHRNLPFPFFPQISCDINFIFGILLHTHTVHTHTHTYTDSLQTQTWPERFYICCLSRAYIWAPFFICVRSKLK